MGALSILGQYRPTSEQDGRGSVAVTFFSFSLYNAMQSTDYKPVVSIPMNFQLYISGNGVAFSYRFLSRLPTLGQRGPKLTPGILG
jgi:hypothetical protein